MTGRAFMGLAQSFFLVTPAITYFAAGIAISNGGRSASRPGPWSPSPCCRRKLFDPVREILQVSIDVRASMALFERIFGFLDMRQDVGRGADARPLDAAARGHIEFRDVGFRYDRRRRAPDARRAPADPRGRLSGDPAGPARRARRPQRRGQDDPHLPAGPRSTTSTRARSLLDGADVRDIQLASLAENIGMVTQEPYLFHASVRENLLYARPGRQRRGGGGGRARRPHPRADHRACRTATTRWSGSAATACPAARSSASRSPA